MLERIKALFQSMPTSMKVIFYCAIVMRCVVSPLYGGAANGFLIDALFLLILIFKKRSASHVGNYTGMLLRCIRFTPLFTGAIEKFIGLLDSNLHHGDLCLWRFVFTWLPTYTHLCHTILIFHFCFAYCPPGAALALASGGSGEI